MELSAALHVWADFFVSAMAHTVETDTAPLEIVSCTESQNSMSGLKKHTPWTMPFCAFGDRDVQLDGRDAMTVACNAKEGLLFE
eukprot:56832-Pleurochrysis_carterae.AAC.1